MKKKRAAIVLSGGGSRGAYEAGVILYLRGQLSPSISEKFQFKIYSGASVGAINAVLMITHAHEPQLQGKKMVEVWENLKTGDVYRRGTVSLGKLLLKNISALFLHLIGMKGVTKKDPKIPRFQSLFDTKPFLHTLMKHAHWANISKNISEGLIEAFGVVATNVQTGELELFLEKNQDRPFRIRMKTRECKITPRHIMASAALPLLFPPVPIDGVFYNDGGLKLSAPISPAAALGASHILIVGTSNRPLRPKEEPSIPPPPSSEPGIGSILGKLLDLSSERLEIDKAQMDRINHVLEVCQQFTTPEEFQNICQIAGVRPIQTLSLFPSVDPSKFVATALKRSYRKLKSIGILERAVLRLLEIDEESGSDFLSHFLMEPSYIKQMIALGYEDARQKHNELLAFCESAMEEK